MGLLTNGKCSKNPWGVRHAEKPPIDDVKAGTPALPLPGDVSAGFRIKLAEPIPGRFCAPRKEGFTERRGEV